MIDSHLDSTEAQRNILEYLKALRSLPEGLDVEVTGDKRTGVLYIRRGQVVAAECGELRGNGALFTLAASGSGIVREESSKKPVEKNVSVTISQVARFLAKQPDLSQGGGYGNEERTLEEAIRLFFQFRRKEAGVKLVEVLRSNRFYYPAWLWHSRLMTRKDHIKKALFEAGTWGNTDPLIKNETKKINPQLTDAPDTVKRCIFCWSLIRAGMDRCESCQGLQRVTKTVHSGEQVTAELQQSVLRYEEELLKNPQNLRVAYCLCLGFYSLGKVDRAREYIAKALKIAPREPLFVKAAAILQPVQQPPRPKEIDRKPQPAVAPVSPPVDRISPTDKTVLVVEDSRTARKVVSMVLGRRGYKIVEATSGTEALLTIEGVTPDLILLDVMLPDMTGYDVMTAIRKNSRLSDVPVVMLTGKRGASDRLKGMMSGSNEYLTKPFDPAKLLSVLGKYLEPSVAATPAAPAIQATPVRSVQRTEPRPAPVKPEMKAKPPVIRPAVAKPAVVKPIAVPPAKAGPTAPVTEKKDTAASVLVVEDSPTSRRVISMVLTRKGYVVSEAATGGEALRQVENESPSLILLDAMLPDMTGYDILARIQQEPRLKDIPVVMLTAKDSPLDREKGMRAGATAYLTKPFNPDKLLSVIGSYI